MNDQSAPTPTWQTPELIRLSAAGTAGITPILPSVTEGGHYVSGGMTSSISTPVGPLGAAS